MRPTIEVPSELLKRAMLVLKVNAKPGSNSEKAAKDLEPYLQIANIPKYHIEGRRWFQRSYGNTYHTVRIYENDELVFTSDPAYGYGDQCLETAFAWLRKNRTLPPEPDGREFMGTLYLREVLHGTYSVSDVKREREL